MTKCLTSKYMNDYSGPWTIVWLALIESGVIYGCRLQHQRHCGRHLGLVNHDGDTTARTPDRKLGVVVVPSNFTGRGEGPGDDTGNLYHAGGVKIHHWASE